MASRPVKYYTDISGTCSTGSAVTESHCLCGSPFGVWNGSSCSSGSDTGYTWTFNKPDRIFTSTNLLADNENMHGICSSGNAITRNACLCDTSEGAGDGFWDGSSCDEGSATGYTWTITIKEIAESTFDTKIVAYEEKIMVKEVLPDDLGTADGELDYLYVHAGSCSGNDTTSTTKKDCEDSNVGGGVGTWTAGTSFKQDGTGLVIDITARDDLTTEDEAIITQFKDAITKSYIEEFPPIPAFWCKAFDIWFITEGLHRIYASYDLAQDIPYIEVTVDEKIKTTNLFVYLYRDEILAIDAGLLGTCTGESGGTPYSDNKADCGDSGVNGSAGTWTEGTTTMTSVMYLNLVAERNSWYSTSTAANPEPPVYGGGGSAE
jgi:hypothetical protein